MKVGLRIDVDTFRGTRLGVPNLRRLLARHSIGATFFFTVGPDNMGRHLWRLIRPAFLVKMLRTNAASLYGWDILLRGTFWPGPVIGEKLGGVIRATADAGHEVGFHAWDHHAWQARIDSMTAPDLHDALERGVNLLAKILGQAPVCSAAASWKCNDMTLLEKSRYPFAYNSDCRGESVFFPVVDGKELPQPQIPVTLPTYDEVVGRNGVTPGNFNDHLLGLLKRDGLNVLTVHAESEGIACLSMFDDFLRKAKARGAEFVPLGRLLSDGEKPGRGRIVPGEVPGREGWVARQEPDL